MDVGGASNIKGNLRPGGIFNFSWMINLELSLVGLGLP